MTPSLASLTAVILNWRTPDLAVRAAEALFRDGLPRERLVVVDNGSADGSAERLEAALPGSTLVRLSENAGFARGNNAGAQALEGSAYLFVNSDAFLARPGSLSRLLHALDDPRVGIAVPRLVNEDGTLQPSVVPLSTPLPELVRASGLSRFVPNRLQPSLGTHWDHGESRRIQAAVGAVLLVRGETWRELGGFDERRFMYAEDHDLFWRARKAGWTAQFVADAVFVHLGGGTTARAWSDPERAQRVARSEVEMLRGHMPAARAGLTIGLMALGILLRGLCYRAVGRADLAAVHRAWLRGCAAALSRRDGARAPRG